MKRNKNVLDLWGVILGAIIGAGATILTSGFGYLNKDRELDIRMVEIGLSILNGEKTEKSEPARQFAVNLIEKYSGVDILQKDQWVKTGDVPYDAVSTTMTKQHKYQNSLPWRYVISFFSSRYGVSPEFLSDNPSVTDLPYYSMAASIEVRQHQAALVATQLIKWLQNQEVDLEQGVDINTAFQELTTTLSESSRTVQDIVTVIDKTFLFISG